MSFYCPALRRWYSPSLSINSPPLDLTRVSLFQFALNFLWVQINGLENGSCFGVSPAIGKSHISNIGLSPKFLKLKRNELGLTECYFEKFGPKSVNLKLSLYVRNKMSRNINTKAILWCCIPYGVQNIKNQSLLSCNCTSNTWKWSFITELFPSHHTSS